MQESVAESAHMLEQGSMEDWQLPMQQVSPLYVKISVRADTA